MSDQEVSFDDSTTAGDAGDRAVTAEWRRIQRERIDDERAEAEADADPVGGCPRRRVPWAGLLAALAAGVMAAVLANIAVGPRDRPGGDQIPGVGAPLGLLARPATSEDALPSDGEAAEDAEPPAVDDPGEPDVEVFVPVPRTAVGAPPRPAGAAP